MKPYYDSNGIRLYCGDAADILPTLDTVDLLLTDPPYGVNYQSNLRNERGREKLAKIANDRPEDRETVLQILRLAYRRLRECRHAYVFGPFDLVELGFGGVADLIWDKGQQSGGDLSKPWGSSHESLKFGVRVASAANRRDGYGNGAARLRRGSVLHYARLHGSQLWHPNQKPVLLLRELIESSSCIGETVLDPFAGSGSTLVAALREGRKAIGVEIDKDHCGVIAARLDAEAPFETRETAE